MRYLLEVNLGPGALQDLPCDHELILNGACYFCGTTELDPVARSAKKSAVIPPG